MIFKEGSALYTSEIERKQGEDVLYLNYLGANFVPSLAERDEDMARVVELLAENPSVSRVVFVQQRNYNYSFEQVVLLKEIASLYNFLTKQENLLSSENLRIFGNLNEVYPEISYIISLMRQDPIECYTELKKRISDLRMQLNTDINRRATGTNYLRFLERILLMLRETSIVKKSDLINIKGRKVYNEIFRPDILPNFTFTRLVSKFPDNSELISEYEIGKDEKFVVTILKTPGDSKYFYHVMPPEYTLTEEQQMIVNLARTVLAEHRPKAEEFTDPERTRQVFYNVALDLVGELAKNKRVVLNHRELERLANILVRYTIGFGLVEILLMDEKLQDILLNAPIAQNSIFVRHEQYDECRTNILPSFEDAESWAAKLRLQSGRPLDEANPVLDTDLVFGESRARVAAIKEPLSPQGLAFAFRRHRDNPWTLPLFIKNKMINSFGAGLLSFLIDGNRTLLVAGTRGSGKTSLLGSLMLEIMSKYRVIVVEDTLELPVDALRKIGYDILRLKVKSALVKGTNEMEASEGIRTSLRLGDSALIVGEVRSAEAKALYEAMRVGALANVVAGTIHGDSAYGVFDRVVNDLGVEPTSFKATDLIIIANPIKTADGLHSIRRITSVCEVRKHWNKDPSEEGGFVELLRYNVDKDELEPTEELINGDSEIIKSIASNVKGWAGNWDAVFDNIILRGKIKQEIVDIAERTGKMQLLESEFNSLCNSAFHDISDKVRQEYGLPLGDKVLEQFKSWITENSENY